MTIVCLLSFSFSVQCFGLVAPPRFVDFLQEIDVDVTGVDSVSMSLEELSTNVLLASQNENYDDLLVLLQQVSFIEFRISGKIWNWMSVYCFG